MQECSGPGDESRDPSRTLAEPLKDHKALRTHILSLLDPKAIPHKAFGEFTKAATRMVGAPAPGSFAFSLGPGVSSGPRCRGCCACCCAFSGDRCNRRSLSSVVGEDP